MSEMKSLGEDTSLAAQILTRLNDQDRTMAQTNHTIFEKLDEAAKMARDAATKALEVHAETMGIKTQIESKFKELNGGVARAIDRVAKLEEKDNNRDAEALKIAVAANAVTAATKGIWMIPKPDAMTTATTVASVVAVISLIASGQAKDFFVWLASRF